MSLLFFVLVYLAVGLAFGAIKESKLQHEMLSLKKYVILILAWPITWWLR